MTLRLAMWSGPRNISTALMRSWENRADTSVVDEPFYAYYLQQTQSPHPGFDEILAQQSSNYDQVAWAMSQATCPTPIQYQKHMTHHMLPGVDLSWAGDHVHCFLIRDPAQVVNSYSNARGVCSVEDIGIVRQLELYESLSAISDQTIPVIDSNDVLRNPAHVLGQLCERLGISFDNNMLTWPAGKRDSDGVWAPYWYGNVEASTGFSEYKAPLLNLTEEQQAVVEEVTPHYTQLATRKIT